MITMIDENGTHIFNNTDDAIDFLRNYKQKLFQKEVAYHCRECYFRQIGKCSGTRDNYKCYSLDY